MALSDIYQIKAFQSMFDEPIMNVFYYEQTTTGTPGSAADLANVFLTDFWVAAWRPAITNRLELSQVQVVNGMDNDDQYVEDVAAAGGINANACPTNIALEFRKRNIGIGGRYSYKRFSSINAANIGNGEWAYALNDAAIYALSQALGALLVGDEASYSPVQVTGGFALGVVPTRRQSLSGQWQFNRKPSHQDTRQQYAWALATAP